MRKWKIPSPYNAKTAADYFLDMTELNAESKSFSQRELAKHLGWPISYIPDLIKNRKPFTVARSLEFIRIFKISPIDAEHIIFLAVASQSKTDLSQLKDIQKLRKPDSRKSLADVSLFTFEVLFIFEVLRWLRGHGNRKNLKLIVARQKLSDEVIDQTLDLLIAKDLVEETSKGLTAKATGIFSDEPLDRSQEIRLHQEFADNVARFFLAPFQPGTGSTTFLQIHTNHIAEVKEKIVALRNWIQEVAEADEKATDPRTVGLFQLDMYLLPQFTTDEVKAALPG
jgi:uncharacterized protein (TIGR02147 family)